MKSKGTNNVKKEWLQGGGVSMYKVLIVKQSARSLKQLAVVTKEAF